MKARRRLVLLATALLAGVLTWSQWPEANVVSAPNVDRSSAPFAVLAVDAGVRRPVDPGSAIVVRVAPMREGGSLSGWVVSADGGTPIAGATLDFTAGSTVHAVTTDADGRFGFTATARVELLLHAVRAEGFVTQAPKPELTFSLADGAQIDGVRIALVPELACRGRVLFPDGGAAPGVRLSRSPIWEDLEAFQTESDAEGVFRYPCGPSDRIDATLGRWSMQRVLQLGDDLTLTLGQFDRPAGPTIEGVVLDAENAPLPGVTVQGQAKYERPDEAGTDECEAKTDANGRFVLEPDEPDPYDVAVMGDGLRISAVQKVLPGARGLVFRPRAEGSLVLAVSDAATGAPLPVVTVHLDHADGIRGARVERYLGGPRAIRIERLAAGDVQVRVRAPGYEPSAVTRVTVRPPAVAQAQIGLRRGGVVEGHVRDAVTSAPIAGARVVAREPRDYAVREVLATERAFVTDGRGAFRVDDVANGTTLTFSAAGYRPWEHSGAAARPLDIPLNPLGNDAGAPTEFAGIGISWEFDPPHTIVKVFAGTPAARAGIAPGDWIDRVDGAPTDGESDDVLLARIRGPIGTPIRLRIQRPDGGSFEETLMRDRIAIQPEP